VTTTADVLSAFLELCPGAGAPGLVDLVLDDDVRLGPADGAGALNKLVNRFGPEPLVANGLAAEDSGGQLKLAPGLTGGPIIALRDATRKPFNLLTSAGCLWPDDVTVFEVLNDDWTKKRLRTRESLFAAFEMSDVLLLRACRLPVVLAVGLDQLPLARLEQFSQAFDCPCEALAAGPGEGIEPESDEEECPGEYSDDVDPEEAELQREIAAGRRANQAARAATAGRPPGPAGQPEQVGPASAGGWGHSDSLPPRSCPPSAAAAVQLVLVGWTPSRLALEQPVQLASLLDWFQRLERFLRLDLTNVSLWVPSAETVDKLRFLAAPGTGPLFRAAMAEAGEHSHSLLGHFVKVNASRQLATPTQAFANLHDAVFGPQASAEAWRTSWAQAEAQLQEHFIGPLVRAANEIPDPLHKNAALGTAVMARLAFTEALLLAERTRRTAHERGLDALDQIPREHAENVLNFSERFLDYLKFMDTCRTQAAANLTLDSTATRRWPG
jgi:hypothetical protein